MIPSFENRHSPGGRACPMGGGGGSSSSATTNNTYNTDQRVVADGGSHVISTGAGGTSTVSVNMIDSGAIAGAGQIALASIGANNTNLDHLLATADKLFSTAANSQQASVELTKTLAGTAQTAYADASAQAAGNKNLILAGMAVVAVVAVQAMRK